MSPLLSALQLDQALKSAPWAAPAKTTTAGPTDHPKGPIPPPSAVGPGAVVVADEVIAEDAPQATAAVVAATIAIVLLASQPPAPT